MQPELNAKRYIQLGLKIAYYRKLRSLTQEQLAEKIDMSVGFLSQVEAPNMITPISMDTLFLIADALEIEPHKFLMFEDI